MTTLHLDERHFQWVYSATALTGLLLALFLPSSTKLVPVASRRSYVILQTITLLSAIVGAKLAFLAGDLHWPQAHVSFDEVAYSGRSITGGLLGGLLGAELAKIPLRYNELPNDWFAAKLPLSVAIGRIGCVLAGCCRGIPGDYPVAMVYSDGVARFPAQLCELAFQLVAFGLAYLAFKKRWLRGRVFATYAIAYGLFRIVIEALRDTNKVELFARPVSIYQLVALALALAGAASFVHYSRRVAASPTPAPAA